MNGACSTQLAVAAIPVQQADLKQLHDLPEALDKGTVFPELYLPFYITETEADRKKGCHIRRLKDRGNEECGLLLDIMQTGFFLDDLSLYLDTHPQDTAALDLYNRYDQELTQMTKEFAREYYPLSKSETKEAAGAKNNFAWTDGPAPWEGVCF